MFEMMNTGHNLDLTSKDMDLIEAALQTQKKILSVQSEAGGSGAHKKLSDLQHLMTRINRSKTRDPRAQSQSWSCFARSLFRQPCDSTR